MAFGLSTPRCGEHAVVQGECGLDHPGNAGGGLGVADHRLHRADGGCRGTTPFLPGSARSCSALALSPATVPVLLRE
jgi:hypothetical protein